MRRLLLSVLIWASLLALSPNLRAAVCVAGQPSTAGNTASSPVTSLTLNNPGTQQDDVLLVQVVVGSTNSWITPPSGWTYYSNDTRSSLTQMLFYRVAGASEPSSYTFSFGSARAVGGLLLLRGVSIPGNGNPIAHVQNNSGASSTLTALSANVVSANSLVVRSFAWGHGNDALSGPATQRYTLATGAGPNGVAASSSTALSSGTGQSGNATATAGGSSENWLAVTTVLTPTAGGGICGASQVDHYELVYASHQALTCNPLAVTVRACANSSCSTLYGSPTATTLSATNVLGNSVGNWSSNPLTFTGSASRNYQLTTAGVAILGISSAAPTASNPLKCIVGGVSSNSCAVAFADSGLLLQVPNMLAAKPTPATISAVRKSDNALQCVPAFANVTRSVSFTSTYNNPSSGTQPVVVNGSEVRATPVSLSLNFDATGTAPLNVRYDDAGEMKLSARYFGSAGSIDEGLALDNADTDDLFVSKPYGLCLQTASTLNPTVDCSDASCALFPGGIRAGDSFPLTIRAVGWQADDEALTAEQLCSGNITTPNFRLNNIGLSSTVVVPSNGDHGEVTPASYNHALGNATTPNNSVSEVGVFTLSATPTTSYFGEMVSGGTSGLVGRFIPAYLSAEGSASLTPSCGSVFSYQGQPMAFASTFEPALTVTARNRQNDPTHNYDEPGFWKLADPAVGDYRSVTAERDEMLYPDAAWATELAARDMRLTTLDTASLVVEGANNGDASRTYRWSGQRLTYLPPTVPSRADYPFRALVRQNFSADSLREVDQGSEVCHGVGSGCLDYSYPFTDSPGSEVRLGRLRIGNAHGSELQSLSLPMILESWQSTAGGSFQLEGLDTCTTEVVLGVPMPVPNSFTGHLENGETTPSLSWPLDPKEHAVLLSAPGNGNDGSVQVSFLSAPTWLQYPWDGATRSAARGLATFGIYKGADQLIFRREIYGQ